jgi:hypothetical protein
VESAPIAQTGSQIEVAMVCCLPCAACGDALASDDAQRQADRGREHRHARQSITCYLATDNQGSPAEL